MDKDKNNLVGALSRKALAFSRVKIRTTYWLKIKKNKQGKTEFMTCFTDVIEYVNGREVIENKHLIIFTEQKDAEYYYTEMWNYIREKSVGGLTYNLLNRYWVSQAIYEGLLFPALLAFVLGVFLVLEYFVPSLKCDDHPDWIFAVGALISIFALGCVRLFYLEGKRYAETQIKEVVIVYKKLISEP